MRINNFSIIVGTGACNAACPYCISKMTGIKKIGIKEGVIHWRNFRKACEYARIHGVDTVLMTGKGEPTLFAHQIDAYLAELEPFHFPFIEIQTNGILIERGWATFEERVKHWYAKGMTTVSISVVHYTKEKNQEIYTPNQIYPDVEALIKKLHSTGLMVRLSCTLLSGYVDSPKEVEAMIAWSRSLNVEQLTLRPVVATTTEAENPEIFRYTTKHLLTKKQKDDISVYLNTHGKDILHLGHGAVVYDIQGQNVSFANALTLDTQGEYVRQIIFFPDGKLMYDWQYEGARLL